MNYYELLGVSQTATKAEIRSAAAAMLSAAHPDKSGTDKTSHLVSLVQQARTVLGDDSSRSDYDSSLASKANDSSVNAELPEPYFDSMTGMYQGYLLDKLIARLEREHLKSVDTSPGTIAASPVTMLFGKEGASGGAVWTIPSESSPGDTINVYMDGMVVDTPTLMLAPPKGGVYYADGLMWVVVFTEADEMIKGGRFNFSLEKEHLIDIELPAGSSIMSVVECDGYNVVMVDSRLHGYMDKDMVMSVRRLLDGV